MIDGMNKPVMLICSILFCLHSLYALDIELTHKEAGSDFRLESSRSLAYGGDVSVFGEIELNGCLGFRGGIAPGWLDGEFDIRAFSSVRYAPLVNIPLNINLLYNYNGLPGTSYNSHAHSLLPFISYNSSMAGISLGLDMRFTRYFGEAAIYESILSFSGYVNFIKNDKLLLGIHAANFNEFDIKNMGAYYIGLNYAFFITDMWSIATELNFFQSGSVGLSSIFYGFAYQGGVRFTW